jgi:uncharacterized protein
VPTISGEEVLAVEHTQVWQLLNDPDVLGSAIPGCTGFTRTESGAFATEIAVAVGPVRGVYAGTVEYRDVHPPRSCTIVVKGKGDKGAIEGEGKLTLAPAENGTMVAYQGSFRITGPVAGVGQRLAPGVSRRMIVETLRNIEDAGTAQLAGATPPAAETPVPAADSELDGPPSPGPAALPPLPPAKERPPFRAVRLPSWAVFGAGALAGAALTVLITALA